LLTFAVVRVFSFETLGQNFDVTFGAFIYHAAEDSGGRVPPFRRLASIPGHWQRLLISRQLKIKPIICACPVAELAQHRPLQSCPASSVRSPFPSPLTSFLPASLPSCFFAPFCPNALCYPFPWLHSKSIRASFVFNAV